MAIARISNLVYDTKDNVSLESAVPNFPPGFYGDSKLAAVSLKAKLFRSLKYHSRPFVDAGGFHHGSL